MPPDGVVPEAGPARHQLWLVDRLQFKGALPVFPIAKFWEAGVCPPETAEKETIAGFKLMIGFRGSIITLETL